MISTQDYSLLPGHHAVRTICKAVSVLDAILCQDWVYRYYSYNCAWDVDEEFCEMRNGEGDQMLILFRNEGCVINGFAHESEQPDKSEVTTGLPAIFNPFIFGEPVDSIGTTFCLWKTETENWKHGAVALVADGSEEMLKILDGQAQTYVDWAAKYFEGSYKETGLPLDTVTKIYQGKILTKTMVSSLVDELEDWDQLTDDLIEIGYPFDFSTELS
jgi:hypothetical protein